MEGGRGRFHRICHLSRCRSRSLVLAEACCENLDFQYSTMKEIQYMRDTSRRSVYCPIGKVHRRRRGRSRYYTNPAAAAYRAARSNMAGRGPNSSTNDLPGVRVGRVTAR